MNRWRALGGLCLASLLTLPARAQPADTKSGSAAPGPQPVKPDVPAPKPDQPAKKSQLPKVVDSSPAPKPVVAVKSVVTEKPSGKSPHALVLSFTPFTLTDDQRSARDKAFDLLKQAIHEFGSTYGFQPGTDVNALKISPDPLPQFIIPLHRLLGYSGGDVEPLLVDEQRLIFPILLDNKVRSSITIVCYGDVWRPAALGSAQLSRAIEKARNAAKMTPLLHDDPPPPSPPGAPPTPKRVFSVVVMGGLSAKYLFTTDDNGALQFIPIVNDMRLMHKSGKPEPAKDMLMQLRGDAAQHNGLPN